MNRIIIVYSLNGMRSELVARIIDFEDTEPSEDMTAVVNEAITDIMKEENIGVNSIDVHHVTENHGVITADWSFL